jgi:hypothetical protein
MTTVKNKDNSIINMWGNAKLRKSNSNLRPIQVLQYARPIRCIRPMREPYVTSLKKLWRPIATVYVRPIQEEICEVNARAMQELCNSYATELSNSYATAMQQLCNSYATAMQEKWTLYARANSRVQCKSCAMSSKIDLNARAPPEQYNVQDMYLQ